jgi:AcrR family transcriptional regulator
MKKSTERDGVIGGPEPPTERKRGAETRAALIASGRRVFATKGFDGASVRGITREAGANLGAITYHFGSKRALYEAVLTSGLTPVVERVGEVASGPGTPLDRLAGIVDVFFAFMGANPDLPRLLLQEVAAGKRPPRAVVAILQRNAAYLAGVVTEGFRDGSVRPGHPLLTALSVIAQPIYMTVIAPLLRDVGGIDLSDPATRRVAADHVKRFVRTGLAVRQEASE